MFALLEYAHHHDEHQNVHQTKEPLADSQATVSVFLMWLFALFVYHYVFGPVVKGKIDLWQSSFRLYKMKARHALCAYRKARYLKCMKRCAAKRNNCCLSSRSPDRCVVGECLAKLAKIHMPPPLPWRKKKSRKNSKDALKKQVASHAQEQGSVEDTSGTPSVVSPTTALPHSDILPFIEIPRRSSTPLIDLARMQNWDLVVKQATRRGAKYHDMDGLYPLHWAVSGGPPVEVVDTLLKVYPSASHKLDKEGSAPLHFATHYAASPVVVELLLKAFPKAVRLQDVYGRSPLFHAVDKCLAMESLKLLVQADPSMVTVPCLSPEHRDLPLTRTTATMTPLYMAWARVVRERRIGKGTHKQFKPLEKAHLLLEAAFFHLKNLSLSIPRDYYFLSGAITLDLYLPDDVVPMAVQQFPKELMHADEDGRVALAQAAASSQYSRERSDALIRLLLESCKEAVWSRDREGRVPLQLALMAGKTWSAGVSRLFTAYPEAIKWTDHGNGLPAFAAAASLEAEEAAAFANKLVGEAPALPVVRNDPYNLLNSKQRQLLAQARKRLMGPGQETTALSSDDCGKDVEEQSTLDTERLTTILNLLVSEPSVLAST